MAKIPRALWVIPLMIILGIAFMYLFIIGMLVIAFTDIMMDYNIVSLAFFFILLWLFILALCCRWKKMTKMLAIFLLIPPLFSITVEFVHYYRVGQYREFKERIDYYQYYPFRGKNVISVESGESYWIHSVYPRTEAALALYPLSAGIAESLYKGNTEEFRRVTEGSSPTIFKSLLEKQCDAIFSAYPSVKQREAATEKGLEYEITPFAHESFVFFVRKDNPVDNLTSEQIRMIYSGRLTNWKELGSDRSIPITAYQRNEGSGSQTMLQYVMGDVPIMEPVKGSRLGDMGGIVNDVANYRNSPGALGFSFRVFCLDMLKNDDIKLLSIDGVAPTPENIRNGSYPFITDCCVITVGERSDNVKKIVDFLLSESGHDLIEKYGYIPVR